MKSGMVTESFKPWMKVYLVHSLVSILHIGLRSWNFTSFSYNYLSSEAEAAFGLHHLLQNVALDASSADIFIDHAVLQMDVVYRHADQRQLIGEGKSAQPVVCGEQYSPVSVCTSQIIQRLRELWYSLERFSSGSFKKLHQNTALLMKIK